MNKITLEYDASTALWTAKAWTDKGFLVKDTYASEPLTAVMMLAQLLVDHIATVRDEARSIDIRRQRAGS